MKQVVAAAAFVALAAPPAAAQLGPLPELRVTDAEEQQIGSSVSSKIRIRFGVVQDRAIHIYVSSVGLLLARESSRPRLPWRFIVLDTDGVNAFAAPGGYVHITRGALALIRNEAELAAVLAHEITHVTEKHTIAAITRGRSLGLAAQRATGDRKTILSALSSRAFEMVIDNSYDPEDERASDEDGIALAAQVGYAPGALADFLGRLAERNRNQNERNGLFASHAETKERIRAARDSASRHGAGALVQGRYTAAVKYEAKGISEIAQAPEDGTPTAASSASAAWPKQKSEGKTEEAPAKKGFSLEALKQRVGAERQTAQVAASGGARGVGPDRNAYGGPTPDIVAVTISAAELEEFRRGIGQG
ncbi:MAG TPA: M48 family metalloprotease [Vicinamibacterales bacterium]|nr:M48 family metalloprotease [Vicinamibacterales bacterium]